MFQSLTVALLLEVIIFKTTTVSSAIPGLDSFLSHQFQLDKSSVNDSFHSLPLAIKRALSVSSVDQHVPSLTASLLSFSIPIPVYVRLVGSAFTPDSPSVLVSFLHAVHWSDHFNVITTGQGSDQHSHSFAIKHSPHFDVSHLGPALCAQLSDAVKSAISVATSSIRSPLVSIPYHVVDSIVEKAYKKETPMDGIYVYVLSLGSQSRRYAYAYSPVDSSPAFTKCLGSLWTGKERYVWVDLSAGPLDYGPALSGDGVIPRGEFHPLAALHGQPKLQKILLADLASLIWSAYHVLLAPSSRIPVPFDSSLIVEFIHIHGSESETSKLSSGLDWKAIEKIFMDEVDEEGGGLLIGGQSLVFRTYEVNYAECSICSFAISRSISSFTSRFLFDNYTLISSEYLDSKRLHQILSSSSSADEFRRKMKIPDVDSGRVLPVYVFDLDYDMILLLDRYHQSVSFKDMVIAVRTTSSQTVTDYSCNGHHVLMHARELERAIVGSILQSLWGVSPTHMLWSPRHDSTLVDYTWSVGQTPFGPFSETSSLSFAQKDAARRNLLLTSLNHSITSAIDVLRSMSELGGVEKPAEFTQRWRLLKYKLNKAVSALSHYDFDMALYFLKSSDHDLYAMHSLVFRATEELEASLVCFKDPPLPLGTILFSALCFLSFFFVYAKKDELFRNKRKQF